VKVLKSFYLSSRLFIVAAGLAVLFVFSYFLPQLLVISNLLFAAVVFLLVSDALILFINKKGIYSYRAAPNRLSNGDDNEIKIFLENRYAFRITCEIIDEMVELYKKDGKPLPSPISGKELVNELQKVA